MAAKQRALWDEQWANKQKVENKRVARDAAAMQKEAQKESALERTQEAQEDLQEIENLLKHALDEGVTFNWNSLIKTDPFPEPQPTQPPPQKVPPKPNAASPDFLPKLTFCDHFISSWKLKKVEGAKQRFDAAVMQWEVNAKSIGENNAASEETHRQKLAEWQVRKAEFIHSQNLYNSCVEAREIAYEEKQVDAVTEYCERVLSTSSYPDCFSGEWELEYRQENRLLIVESNLPAPDVLPSLKEVKYVQSKDDLKETYISAPQANKQYESALYKVALRTLYELFKADYVDALSLIVLNGWVKSTDKATGNDTNACVLSIQAKKEEFLKINLAQVDPKVCFKSMKGVSCSTLHSLTPVAPILHINREDSRFISSYAVAESLDASTNLAAMDWEDFEHLIRELFEKEFSQSGGEVKVTQASRDGGVDAVAFDPDPIRGGKIVIQAKRYTNTVGVSAVRDLYGTLLNEGASKGILVTTSDYGPDAYDFAKGKPLTLLSGANLLHLLAKHGHQAKIDIMGAKQILAEKEKQK
ncbi:MAG: restriction endonuclease [Desulfobacteraceae bacterium]|nr:restriction endonuclease [Desulfobacteraceae bacterium]